MTLSPNNFYCSQKFTWLSVDLEKRLIYSCCSAEPEKIDLKWLEHNPGTLFSGPKLQQERQDMLDNKPVASCRSACWIPESQGLESRRAHHKSFHITHKDIKISEPEILNIILGSTCNLTCAYCCKQYSTAWTRDIQDNGVYFDDSRFNLVPLDSILANVSQKDHTTTAGYQTIVNELSNYKNVKQVHITGGEPFLYNGFPDLINNLKTNGVVKFFTGLGVNPDRLKKQLSKIQQKQEITAIVSAETCHKFYEFNRYSNTYQQFLENLSLLQEHFPVTFSSTLSNLTIHGLAEFVDAFQNNKIFYNFCNDPDYLAVNVLDDQTKENLKKILQASKIESKDSIISTMMKPCSDSQRQKLASFLSQFALRRNLSLDIFPATMLKWLDIT